MENNRGLIYFCAGCAVGVAAAVLFTPKSGRETVGFLRNKADEGADYVKQRIGEVTDAITDVRERARGAVRYQSQNVGTAIDAGKQAFKRAVETTP